MYKWNFAFSIPPVGDTTFDNIDSTKLFLVFPGIVVFVNKSARLNLTCVELETTRFSLVPLSYQPPLNTDGRRYVVYGSSISTTYHYYCHNNSYLTINRLDWLLPTKQTKNKWPWFKSGPYRPRLFDLLPFFLTYRQLLRRIFHMDFSNLFFQFFLHFSELSKKLLPLMIFLNIKQRNII